MADEKDRAGISPLDAVGKWTDTGKNIFSLLRDAALFGLFFLLIGCPAILNQQLEKTGLTHFEGPGFRWNRQVAQSQRDSLAAVSDVARVKSVTEAAHLHAVLFANKHPAYARHMQPLRQSLAAITARLDSADGQLVDAVARQQGVIDNASPTLPPIEGWVSLNFVTLDGLRRRGTRGVTRDRPLRVRSESNSSSEVRGVLPIGTPVEIQEVDGNFARIVRR